MLKKDTLETLARRLESEKMFLEEENDTAQKASRPVELDQQSVGRLSRMDAMQGQAMALEAGRRKKIRLRLVLIALRRIKTGDYGFCSHCDEPIDPRRLEFDPAISLCLNCAESSEQ